MKVHRRTSAAVALVLSVSICRPSHASIFGEENAHLATLVGLQLQELGDIAALISHIKLVLSGVNEVASGVRQGYRIYQIIKNYNLEALKRDAKLGLMAAFPELRDIEREVNMLKENRESLNDGSFFSHSDSHDQQMRRVLGSAYRYGFRSSLWPIVYPEAAHLGEAPSEVDLLVHRRLERSGLRAKSALQQTALGILAQKASVLVQDAEDKERQDQISAALTAQAAIQNTQNTTQLTNLAEIEAAREENSIIRLQQLEKEAHEALKSSTATLFEVGSIQ